jgi:hypothetical protein
VLECLNLLSELKSVLVELGCHSQKDQGETSGGGVPALGPDALSVTQQQKVSSILQLVRILFLIEPQKVDYRFLHFPL